MIAKETDLHLRDLSTLYNSGLSHIKLIGQLSHHFSWMSNPHSLKICKHSENLVAEILLKFMSLFFLRTDFVIAKTKVKPK